MLASWLGSVLIGGCATEQGTPAAPEPGVLVAPPILTVVNLPFPRSVSPFRWDAEFRGLVAAALELGLSDLPGVIVDLPGDGAPPAFLADHPAARRQVDARVSIDPEGETLTMELELCIAGGGCEAHTASGTREKPWDMVGTLLEGAAATLGSVVEEPQRARWRVPGSRDPYAELVTGRACATYYGLLPPPTVPDDRKANPVLRAVYLDPAQPIAQWMRARWDLGTTVDGGKAVEALARAALARPDSPLLTADLAATHAFIGRPDQAVLLWDELGSRHPDDPRWFEPRARALLAVGRAADAQSILDHLPSEFTWEPRFAQLRVRVAEAGGVGDLDPLLEHWQTADGGAVEPVRRRIDLRVAHGRFAEALLLVKPLRSRAPGEVTDALETALLTAVGELDRAAELAPPEVAARLRARATREADPGYRIATLPLDDLTVVTEDATAALWRNDAAEALFLADRALSLSPYAADARAVRARALESMGRAGMAVLGWSLAFESDPALPGGPVEKDRISSTFRVVTPEPVESLDPTAMPEVPATPVGPEL